MKKVKRLIEQFKPDHYILNLQPDKQKMTFTGSVIISGHKVGKPSKRLTFHQSELKVTSAHITKHGKSEDFDVMVSRLNAHNRFDEVRLHAADMLYPGRYTIRLEFRGKITDAMNGMYPCYFKYKSKNEKLLATQFESHHAREVFPCIDEPEAKATFDLVITTPSKETVISNTPVKRQKSVGKGLIETTFETTPKMSTYLLAFVYGKMDYREAKTRDGVLVRAYATPENVQFTDFALDFAVKCLEFYNDYFGMNYPLEKCDLIALPDFASGAMENWGCITFREQTLLVDPKNTSLVSKQYVAMVVAHELAHQWFGNLVTMRWWTDLWLNEGFASWIEYLAVDHIYPKWNMWTQFIVDEQQRAMQLDSLHNTHPIEVPVNHPDEIRTIFDLISYSKGSSVIHMLHGYLGPDMFREGLSYYLSTHEYGNTDTVDLWTAFEEVSQKPVRNFMHKWTSLPGYPIIDAQIDEEGVKLHQERFFFHKEFRDKALHPHWPVPLLSGHQELPDICDTVNLNLPTKDALETKLNQGQNGFYRVSYNASHQIRLGKLVAKGHLKPIDRLGLLSDAIETARAGHGRTDEALQLLEYFSNEANAAVWDVIAGALVSVRSTMDDEDLREDMKPFIRKITATQLKRLGWKEKDAETHFDKLLRPTILGLNAGADEPSVLAECQRLFKNMKKTEDISPDVRGIVFNTVARKGDQAVYDRLLKLHNGTTLSEERNVVASALCSFEEQAIIKQALMLITSKEVRRQDVSYWVAYCFMNRFAKQLTWDWLKRNWKWLQKNLGSDLSFFRFPMYAARAFSSREFLADYKDFFSRHRTPVSARSIDQGTETIEWQADWKERDLKLIKAFFKNR